MADTYTLISSVTVGAGGASSITFSSIPSTYTDLKVVLSGRSSAGSGIDTLSFQFNNDTGSNYKQRRIFGDGSSTYSDSYASSTGAPFDVIPASTSTSNTFGNSEFYIPNYAGSTYKSISNDAVAENNATTGYDLMEAGLWSSSSAITSIKLSCTGFVQHSTAYLYGIKNS